MTGRITATEIIRQSEQGVSVRPFLVRGNDGKKYFVKGLNRAGGASLISEVIAADLGTRLGLPIPPWQIMDIPEALIGFSSIDNVSDLTGGPAFASLQIENVSELMWSGVRGIPTELQQRLLVFDWWIQNGDRGLTEMGGNVNLMVDSSGQLVVIDHNAAFEEGLAADEFRTYHVFRDQIRSLNDLLVRQGYIDALDGALQHWDRITPLLPADWIFRDRDEIDETIPTLRQRLETLQRHRDESFWGQL